MPTSLRPKKSNFITTDACNTGLGATLWQREGETLRQWPSLAASSPIAKGNMP